MPSTFRQDHTESEFECHEVYAVDCLVSTGEGRPKDRDSRTTIFKRNQDVIYQLKMKASRSNANCTVDFLFFNNRSRYAVLFSSGLQ